MKQDRNYSNVYILAKLSKTINSQYQLMHNIKNILYKNMN